MTDKALLFNIQKALTNWQEKDKWVIEVAKNINKWCTEDQVQMANEIWRVSNSLNSKIQVKVTLCYHLYPSNWPKI